MANDAVASIMNDGLASIYDWDKPQIAIQLFRQYGMQGVNFFRLFQSIGRAEPVGNDLFYAYEENYIHENFTELTGFGDPGAGVAATFTLSPADLDVNNNFYPRLYDIVTIPGTEVQGQITAIDTTTPTAPELTVTPIDATDTIGAITAGTVISITSGAFGAGTDQPSPAMSGVSKRTFQAQIFKETLAAEGTQLATEHWVEVFDTGENIAGWHNLAFLQGEYRLGLKEDGAYIFGKQNNNAANVVGAGLDGAGNLIKTTKGIVPWMRERGKVQAYTPGTFSITDMDEISLYMTSQGVMSPYILFLMGERLDHEVENSLVDYLKNTGVDFTRMVGDMFSGDEELAVEIGFSQFKKGNRTYLIRCMENFSNPKTFGADGYDMDRYGMLIPLSKYKDPMTGEKVNNICTKYRSQYGYDRKYKIWETGAQAAQNKTNVDKLQVNIMSHHGLQFTKVNQTVLFDPA